MWPVPNSSSTVQCSTSTNQSNYPNDYIVTQNGLSILVNPGWEHPVVGWQTRLSVWELKALALKREARGLSVSQLLNLASTMTA